jgi:hypothetical protein
MGREKVIITVFKRVCEACRSLHTLTVRVAMRQSSEGGRFPEISISGRASTAAEQFRDCSIRSVGLLWMISGKSVERDTPT